MTTPWPSGRALVLAAVVATAAGFLMIEPSPVWAPDYGSYIAISRSLVFDRDLLFINDLALVAAPAWITATGFAVDHHHVGSVLLRLPFHVLGHLAATVGDYWGGGPATRHGVEPPYVLWLKLGDWTYGILALVWTYLLVRRHAAIGSAALALTLVAVGSPFLYHMSFFGPSSHMVSAFLGALFVWAWDLTRGDRGWGRWAFLGGLAGLLALTHTNNVVFLLFPAVEVLVETVRARRLAALGAGAALLALFAVLGALPQLVIWWFMFGTFGQSPYERYLFPERPQILAVLTSPYHGLYFYAPVLALGTLGLVRVWRRDRVFGTSALAALALLIYGNGSSLAWWAGGAFGQRHFLNATPLFAVGLGALLDWPLDRRTRLVLRALAVALTLWTYGLFLQFLSGAFTLVDYVPPGAILRGHAGVLARFPELVLAQFYRPKPGLLFPSVVLFPLVFLGFLVGARAVWSRLVRGGRIGAAWAAGLGAILVAANGFVAVAGVRGQHAQAGYAAEGYYRSQTRVWGFDPWQLASTYVERARYRQLRGDRAGARDDLRKALAVLPDLAEAQALLNGLDGR